MTTKHHDLVHEFPEFRDLIHDLKVSDAHFRKAFDRYHELDHSIHASEQRAQIMSEKEEESLRKERMKLKDELYAALVEANMKKAIQS